jgi:murein DD-endopeptidase MepM/ murein hydrolase activator NlpD
MGKVKYQYNPSTLRYERVKKPGGILALQLFGYGCIIVLLSFAISYLWDSPKERFLKNEIRTLKFEYDLVEDRLDTLGAVLTQLQDRDDNIYRVIFEAEPYPKHERLAGIGGTERLKSSWKNLENGLLLKTTSDKLEEIKRKLVAQSKSYDEISTMIKDKEAMLAYIPAIQPVANKDLRRIASGFGYRIHPITKLRKFHWGIDFTAQAGTEIYSTGDGTVTKAKRMMGYGKLVEIDHGYGYKTRYAHMSNYNVRAGQKVKRGELIGFVGSTGLSTAPHLHYEVMKNDTKINPINFFYHDLTDEDYQKVIELAERVNQSFD